MCCRLSKLKEERKTMTFKSLITESVYSVQIMQLFFIVTGTKQVFMLDKTLNIDKIYFCVPCIFLKFLSCFSFIAFIEYRNINPKSEALSLLLCHE